MSKLFIVTLLFVLMGGKILFAQDLEKNQSNYGFQNLNAIEENGKKNEHINSLKYDQKHNQINENNINNNSVFDNKNEQISANSDAKSSNILPSIESTPQTPAIIPKKNKKNVKSDGMGTGFRVYDNSNRQSYFCGLNQAVKPKFKHDNNFNGVYFGVAVNSISSTVDFSLKNVSGNNVVFVNGKPVDFSTSNFSQGFSGSNVLPSIILGQGRLFSNGLFLGQEASINIGEFSAKKKNTQFEDINFDEIKMFSSNFSSYSGKFGYNIFRNFLPYVKVSLSLSPMKYLIKVNDAQNPSDRTRYLAVGGLPNFGIGAGMDISLYEHVRMMIDWTYFSSPGGEFNTTMCTNSPCQAAQEKRPEKSSTFSIAKVGVVWRF